MTLADIEGQTWVSFEAEVRKYSRIEARKMGLPPQDWEDAEQAGVLAVWKNLTRECHTNRRAMLMRCARNSVVDLKRQTCRHRVYDALPLLDQAAIDHDAE